MRERERHFKELLLQVQSKLEKKYGKKYSGLFFVAVKMVNLYLNKYCKSDECEYIRNVRYFCLLTDFLGWLSHIHAQQAQIQFKEAFDFEKTLAEIEPRIYQLKRRIYYQWISGKTKEEIKELEKLKKINFLDKMYLNLLKNYPTFEFNKLKQFKRELGLCQLLKH